MFSIAEDKIDLLLKQAYESYSEGQNALTIYQRKTAFNQALALYHQVESISPQSNSIAKLYVNLGHCYFQLEQYSLAIYYYSRALSLKPRQQAIQDFLFLAQTKLALSVYSEKPSLKSLFFLKNDISLSECFHLFLIFGIITLALLSITVWFTNPIFKWICFIFGIVTVYCFLTMAYHRYFLPIKGVLVQSTELYQDKNLNSPPVTTFPIINGTTVNVIDILDKGHWIKIVTPEGELGYVPFEAIRLF